MYVLDLRQRINLNFYKETPCLRCYLTKGFAVDAAKAVDPTKFLGIGGLEWARDTEKAGIVRHWFVGSGF